MTRDLVDRLLSRARSLEPSQGFHFGDLVVAKTKAGELRLAGGTLGMDVRWYRGSFEELLSEAVETSSDWRRLGYFAHRFVREAEQAASGSTPTYRLEGIGRRQTRALLPMTLTTTLGT